MPRRKNSKKKNERNSNIRRRLSIQVSPNAYETEGAYAIIDDENIRKLDAIQTYNAKDYLSSLSLEMLCHIAEYLPLRDVMKLECLSHKMQETVSMHLNLIGEIDFCQGNLYGWMPNFVDETFLSLLQRCKEVMFITGLHPKFVSKRRQRGVRQLSIPGMIASLQKCTKLKGVEISDPFLLEAVLKYLPSVEIIGNFINREESFPVPNVSNIVIPKNPLISTLHLTGVSLTELPRMVTLENIYLKWVKFTETHPFREFAAPNLRTFVMNNCMGPLNALKYVPLITGLASAKSLNRMEFVRVPFLGGLIQHVVEDSWRMQGFRQLHKITVGTCKHVLEVDIGFLAITCAAKLEELSLQPSLTKDSLFASLILADVNFPNFETLHLGHEDPFPESDKLSNEELLSMGLADVSENPANITDIGMKSVGQVFSTIKSLSIYNCPHLLYPTTWFIETTPTWQSLRVLHLRRCHAVRLYDFCAAIPCLPQLECLYLEQMFREPPKGCSRVGLSAGTGLGVSAALVSNTGTDAANNDPADEEEQAEEPQVEGDPLEGTSNQNSTSRAKDKEAAGQRDSDNEIDSTRAGTSRSDNLEPGVVETDGIFYSVPECEMSGIESSERGIAAVGTTAQSVPTSGVPEDGAGVNVQVTRRDPSPEPASPETNGSLSLTSVICSTSTTSSRSVTNEVSCTCNEAGQSGESSKKNTCSSSNSKNTTNDSVTIVERKVGNQSVYVVQKDPVCCRNTPGHSHSPSVVVKGTSQIPEPEAVTADEQLAPLSCSGASPSTSGINAGNSPAEKSTGGKRGSSWKGKSLQGKKKGLAKLAKSSNNNGGKHEDKAGKDIESPQKAPDAKDNPVSKSCQAVSEEIRESTKKKVTLRHDSKDSDKNGSYQAESRSKDTPSKDTTQSAATSPTQPGDGSPTVIPSTSRTRSYRFGPMIGPIGEAIPDSEEAPAKQQHNSKSTAKKSKSKKRVTTKDQSTSTSDPVIEEDHVQVLYLKSTSLMNLTLHQVGITSLVITSCPKLKSISGTSCRVLKQVSIKRAISVTKVSFAQCKKLLATDVVREVASLPNGRKRFVSLRPMFSYDVSEMERALFMPPDYGYNMCLIHDHSPNPSATLYNKLRASVLLDFIEDFNFKLLCDGVVTEASRERDTTPDYPWGRSIYMLEGKLVDGSAWEMMTDIPWLRELAECEKISAEQTEGLNEQVTLDGIYEPQAHGYFSSYQALDFLYDNQAIAEFAASRQKLHNSNMVVYVNTCDVNGKPVSDIYV